MNSTRRSTATVRCEPGLLYDILTDYDNYNEWLPLAPKSKALAREGDLALAEFELAPPLKDRFVVECIHTKNKMVLWRRVEGRSPVAQVEWNIASAGGDGQTQVSLTVTGPLNWDRLASAYKKFLDPAAVLKALQGQVSTFMPEIAITDAEGEKILDLMESEDGVICYIRGKKFVLKEEVEVKQ